jgi:hypothetical protein
MYDLNKDLTTLIHVYRSMLQIVRIMLSNFYLGRLCKNISLNFFSLITSVYEIN